MDIVKVHVEDDSKFSFIALIEKVAKDEIKKLAAEVTPIKKHELIKDSSAPPPLTLLNIKVISSSERAPIEATTLLQETTKLSATTGSMDLDSETILPTNAPAVESEMIKLETASDDTTETLQNRIKVPEEVKTTENSLQLDENAMKETSISDSLLNAVGDLLSSILGLEGKKTDENSLVDEKQQIVKADNEIVDTTSIAKEAIASESKPITTTIALESGEGSEIEQGTEKTDEATPVGFEGEDIEVEAKKTNDLPAPVDVAPEKIMNEVDLKIENLANAQTSFATENTLEQVTETVREELSESGDNEPDVLEVISDPSNESGKPVSFEESVNQIMNLVRSSEGHMSDSILIDNNMKKEVSDLDQMIYGTLKDIDSNLGVQEDVPVEAYDPAAIPRGNLFRTIQAEISKHPFEYDNFVLNSAKAALHYKWQDDVDF